MTATTEMMKPETLTPATLESIVIKGDLSGLSPKQKTEYYVQLCMRVGLDPATQPFKLLKLNGKEIAYADKGAAEQLRKVHCVGVQITSRERIDDVYVVTARATLPDGRTDESQGAVTIANLKGDNLANAIMKAETKAKRRVTLSIVGLGMLDESELETIPADRFAALRPETQQTPEQSNVKQLPAPKKAEKPKEKWTPAAAIPDSLMRALPFPMRELNGIALDRMTEEDLELLMEHAPKSYAAWKQMPNVSPKALALLQEITIVASGFLAAKQGKGPPPNDAPTDADEQPPPLDFDAATGEVIP